MKTPFKLLLLALLTLSLACCGDEPMHDELDDHERTEMISFLKEHLPDHHQEFIEEEDDELLYEAMGIKEEWEDLKEIDPKAGTAFLTMLRLEDRATRIADKIVLSKDEAEINKLSVELRQLLSEQLDARLVFEEAQIALIQKQIAEFQAEHERDKNNRAEVLAEDFKSILEDSREDLAH